jgi:beta-phosphoglucomutase
MDQSELLPGVLSMLQYLKKKTNRLLWDQPAKMQDLFWRKRIRHYFDAIVDVMM